VAIELGLERGDLLPETAGGPPSLDHARHRDQDADHRADDQGDEQHEREGSLERPRQECDLHGHEILQGKQHGDQREGERRKHERLHARLPSASGGQGAPPLRH
jgi:hypothetical protein